jgi:hypothetical protein
MRSSKLAPEDIPDLPIGVGGCDSDAACCDPPSDESSGDPVLATTKAGRDSGLRVVSDGLGDGFLDGPGVLVEYHADEARRIPDERLIALLELLGCRPVDRVAHVAQTVERRCFKAITPSVESRGALFEGVRLSRMPKIWRS